jgi:hypothetical protein
VPGISLASQSSSRRTRSFVWILTAVAVCLLSSNLHSQTEPPYLNVQIDLEKVMRSYDELNLYREAVWDTVPPFDYSTFKFGPENKIPHFLKSDFGRYRRDVDYFDDVRVTCTYPRVYSFELRQITEGEYYTYIPRDVTIPGLSIEIEGIEDVAENVRVASLREAWRQSVVRAVTSQEEQAGGGRREGLINVDIPLPMPSQLESIFGPGENTHINISGREEITFAGESRKVDPFIGVEGQQKQSLFPSLDMEQKLDVTLTGTIGDKVHIQVDHSSQTLADKRNNIQLWYEGYEDDIIKRVDLGNTNLSLTGSNLVSFSTASTGLFGVKILADIGATELTVIASKQEGETSGASFSPTGAGGLGQTEERVIQDISYIKNKFFYFNDPRSSNAVGNYLPDGSDAVGKPIEVWVSMKEYETTEADFPWEWGRAFVDPDGNGAVLTEVADAVKENRKPVLADSVKEEVKLPFRRLEVDADFGYIRDVDDKNTIIGLELRTPVQDDQAVAVTYYNIAGDKIGGSYSSYDIPLSSPTARDTTILELIKHRNVRETDGTWYYMMRNFYNLGLSNIEPASFELEIRDRTQRLDTSSPPGSDIPYIQIFGLDNFNDIGQPGHDGRVDFQGDILDPYTGILQFPDPFAFAPRESLVQLWTDSLFSFEDTSYAQHAAYKEQWNASHQMYTRYLTNPYYDASRYDIVVRAVSTSKSFRLDALNIVEDSERITLDGRPLARGSDYTINYDTGEVELKGDVLNSLTPTSKLNIDYEFTPFGGSTSSSLVGFSTQSNFSQNARLGTIFLYESKGTSMEKPRLGEEPTRAIVGGINGQLQHNSKLLTRMANLLPMVDTDAKSSITVSGEIAASLPDPNTKGEAYIEDFEGIEDSDRFTTSRRSWHPSSPPVDPLDESRTLEPDSMQSFIWYNIEPDKGGAHRRDFNPDLNDRENTLVPTLDVEVDGIPRGPDRNWVGVMTGFGAGGLDLSRGQYLEVWVNDFKPNPAERGGYLRIDMGRIDEDFFEPDQDNFDLEDQERDGWQAAWDDTGLDGMFNINPDAVKNNPGIVRLEEDSAGTDPNLDLHGDDYIPSRIDGRFSKINGTEKNNAEDTEDLDRSGAMEETNSYYSFVIDLSDTAVVDIRESFPGYDGFDNEYHQNDSWRLYRVKLSDATVVAPKGIEPRWNEIRHVRVWIDDVETVFQDDRPIGRRRLQLAEMKVVGNRWELDGVRDLADTLITDPNNRTEFTIGVISTKTDPARYNAPIVPREENGVFEKEQSMFIKYDSLEAGTQIRVFKQFIGRGQDLTSYRDLNFWVHADPIMFHSDLEYYLRLAFDENNFYEIKFPVTEEYFDPATGWMYGLIKLEDLTSLKIAQSDSVFEVSGTIRDQVEKDRRYQVRVVRNPNIFDVRFLYAGVRNVSQTGMMFAEGEIWIDDIYAGDVRRDIGLAERVSGSVNIGGGVISLNGTWEKRDADFRGLRQRRGSGIVNESYGFNGRTSLEHFIPLFGFNVPVSGNFSRTRATPRYLPNGDTELNRPELQDSLRTETVTRSFSTSLGKKGSQNPLFKYTIDKMTTNFSFSQSMSRSPVSRDTSTTMTGSLRYQINWTQPRDIPLIRGAKFRYWLNALNFNINANRRSSTSYRFRNGQFVKQPYYYNADVRMNGSVNYSPFRSLTSSFQAHMTRDMNRPHYLWGIDIGIETSRGHGLNVSYKPPPIFLIGAFSPDINLTTGYSEDSSPKVRRQNDPEGTRNVTSTRNASVKMRFDLGHYFSKLFGVFGRGGENGAKGGAGRGGAGGGYRAEAGGGAGSMQPAGQDTVQTARGADPLIALRKLGEILTSIRKINVNVQQRFNSSYTRIPERPSLIYQLGFTESSGIVTRDGPLDRPDRTSTSLTINADTGVQITDNLDLSTRFLTTLTNSASLGAESESKSSVFPDVSVKWSGIERFAFFRPLFKAATANVTFRKELQQSGRKGQIDSKKDGLSLTPTMTFSFKNDINSTLAVSYQNNKSTNRGNVVENTNWSISMDLKKDFRGGSGFKLPIPFLSKEIKWTSTLNSNLNISYTRSSGKRYQEGAELFQPIPMSSTLKVSPSLTYNFSRALNGRIFAEYGRAFAQASNQTTTTLRIGVSAILTF